MRVCFRLPEILFLHLLVQDDTDFISSLSLLSFFYLSSFPLLSLFSLSLSLALSLSLLSLSYLSLSLFSLSYLSLISLLSLLSLSLSLSRSRTVQHLTSDPILSCSTYSRAETFAPLCAKGIFEFLVVHFRIPRCLLLFWILPIFEFLVVCCCFGYCICFRWNTTTRRTTLTIRSAPLSLSLSLSFSLSLSLPHTHTHFVCVYRSWAQAFPLPATILLPVLHSAKTLSCSPVPEESHYK